MTAVSEQMYGVICKYCGNCDGDHCLADVSYYAVSIYCKHFTEEKAEERLEVMKKTKEGWIRRKVLRSLVETF
jgi:hypothetical protein